MEDTIKQLQKDIFRRLIRENGKDTVRLWMEKKFGLGQASVYRRLSGETLLDLKELTMLMKKFEISAIELFDAPKDLLYFFLENNRPKSYEEWMQTTSQNFSKVAKQPNALMHYTSTENPVFYYFHFEELTHFKLYIWAKTIWQLPELEEEPFSLKSELWTNKVSKYQQDMLKTYTTLPSVEFWTPNLMSINLNQIQYYLEGYHFEDRYDALLLCDQLHSMLKLLKEQTQTGYKTAISGIEEPSTFELYYNEIIHTNNTILFTSDAGKALYATFGNPNTIQTQQETACDYTEEWFGKLKQRSMRVSHSSERERSRLFKKMEEKINKAERLFKGML